MADEQGAIFFEGEGDRWFSRNASVLATDEHVRRDLPLRMLSLDESYRPKRVLEIGCSTGWRLAALRERYGCSVVGVEPSAAAIEEGKHRYGDIDLRRGLSRALPTGAGETFDLVVAAFMFHWVSRDSLIASIAEVDRVLEDTGHLVLFDFFPNAPARRPYHHLETGKAHTFKQEIAQAFIGTGVYRHVARSTAPHAPTTDDLLTLSPLASNDRVACDILEKDLNAYADG